MTLVTEMALLARLALRDSARGLLKVIDGMAEHEIAAAGYSRDEIATLERIAAWHIAGAPAGNWPQ